jgi:predicted nucleotidyltransferase
MQISAAELDKYRKTARKNDVEKRLRLEERRQRGLIIAGKAAAILRQDFGVTRVKLIGSLIHPELFHSRSDIDLAVWDIKSLYRAVSKLLDIDPDFQIDVIPVEDASPELVNVIESEGVDL